jgi:iron(III) transport system ATP-binding protein
MADQVAVLRHGVIAQLDTPAGIYQRPLDPALAHFLGEANVIHTEVDSSNGSGALVAATPLGPLTVAGWPEAGPSGPAHVLIRPEQLVIGAVGGGALPATVESYEYYGHDAVVHVRPEPESLPTLVVRITGGPPLEPGKKVGLTVRGPVVAWPLDGSES